MQRTFDFTAAATEARKRELGELLDGLGLTRAEGAIVTYVWTRGLLADNQSAVTVSQSALCRAIGYGRTWTREAIDNLVAFGVLADASNGRGRPLSYRVDWSRLKTMPAVRATGVDPFAAFAAAPETCSPTCSVGCSPTCSETCSETCSQTCSVTCSPQASEPQKSYPQNPHPHPQSNEGAAGGAETGDAGGRPINGWGRSVSPDELRSWAGRTALFRLACAVNPQIDLADPDDRIGFVAAVLCALEQGRNPPALLLRFVRDRAWRRRGRGGVDGHWHAKATALLREREAERRREPVGVP